MSKLEIASGEANLEDICRRQVQGADANGSDETALVGAVVTDVLTSDSWLRFEFEPVSLVVDLSEEAWSGPEAAVLYVEGRPAVVWA